MQYLFFDLRSGAFAQTLLVLIGLIKAFSVKKQLGALFDLVSTEIPKMEAEFKACLKKYAQYEKKLETGMVVIETDGMDSETLELFHADMKTWRERFIEGPKVNVLLPESIANNLEISSEAFLVLTKYVNIEVTPENELDILRDKTKELESRIEAYKQKEQAVQTALKTER